MHPALFLLRVSLILLCTTALAFAQDKGPYRPLTWLEMLPAEDLEILFNPPPIEHLGSEEGPGGLLRNNRANAPDPAADDPVSRFEAAMSSVKVMPALDQNQIRLAGFVVPLEYDEKERVTQFFLVPYFGACIHTPPPPPNQIVYVSYEAGLELSSIFDPFFIEGTLRTTLVENDMATAAYSLAADHVLPYSEEEAEE
jgi:hypothetical protein